LSGESKEPFRRASGIAEPYLSRAADRPLITHGLQSGDMRVDSGGGLGAYRPAG
jgi:phosphodiesterase/alkaline phosphatase D-like protein